MRLCGTCSAISALLTTENPDDLEIRVPGGSLFGTPCRSRAYSLKRWRSTNPSVYLYLVILKQLFCDIVFLIIVIVSVFLIVSFFV